MTPEWYVIVRYQNTAYCTSIEPKQAHRLTAQEQDDLAQPVWRVGRGLDGLGCRGPGIRHLVIDAVRHARLIRARPGGRARRRSAR